MRRCDELSRARRRRRQLDYPTMALADATRTAGLSASGRRLAAEFILCEERGNTRLFAAVALLKCRMWGENWTSGNAGANPDGRIKARRLDVKTSSRLAFQDKEKGTRVSKRPSRIGGGGGNRTPVPWHFNRSFYVCVPSFVFSRPSGLRWTGFQLDPSPDLSFPHNPARQKVASSLLLSPIPASQARPDERRS